MLMMRLQRVGRRNDPSYRVVVVDKRTGPKSNKNLDILGSYNPKMNHVQLNVDKAKEWISKGVQPSDTVHNILISEKVIEGTKINVLPKKSPIIDEAAQQAAEAAAAEATAPAAEGESPEDASAEEAEAAAEETPTEEPVPAREAGATGDAAETEVSADADSDAEAAPAEEKKAEEDTTTAVAEEDEAKS